MTEAKIAEWNAYLNQLSQYVKLSKVYMQSAGPGSNPPTNPPPPPGV